MRRINSSIIRIKNSDNEYVSLTALRGYSSYELAVQCGFEGSEEEWMNSVIGDGWVGAFQQLEDSMLRSATYSVTIPAAWSGDTAPYTCTVAVDGIRATDNPHITPVYTSDVDIAMLQKSAWSLIDKAETSDGNITFSCFGGIPAVAINVQIEVIR
jgi:hypothetical protein